MEFSAEMIAGFLGGEIVGDPKAAVSTLAKIEEGAPGALSFLANPKYEHYIYNSRSSIVIVNKSFEPTAPVPATMIKVDDAYSCFAKLLELYAANRPQKKGISERAAIDATAALGRMPMWVSSPSSDKMSKSVKTLKFTRRFASATTCASATT